MKRLLPVVVLLVLALVAVAWWTSRGSPTSATELVRDATPAAPAAPAPEAPPQELGAPSRPVAETPAPAAESAAPQGAERLAVEELERRARAERASVVRGRVTVPAGCALADEDAQAFACKRRHTVEELARWLAGEREDRPNDNVLARAPIAADGTFALALEPDAGEVWLTLRGRRIYCAEAVAAQAARADEVPLAAECGAYLSGRLIAPRDATADALDEAELQIATKVQGAIGPGQAARAIERKVDVGPGGAYEFRALPAGGPFAIAVESERVACTTHDVAVLVAGETRAQDLSLVAGARVLGRVVDERGAAVSGARVEAREPGRFFGFDDREVRGAESDADGRFALEAVLPGKVLLVAEAEGYIENDGVEIELVDRETHEGARIELGRGAAIAGLVTWPDGRPAAGVEVDVGFDMSQLAGMGAFNARRGTDGEGTTDADGRFRVTGLGKGPFTVRASARPSGGDGDEADDGEKAPRHSARADGVQPGDETLELVLEEPIVLRGRVVSSLDGTPVPSFEVGAHEASEGLLGALGKESAKDEFEDDEGRFALEGVRGGSWTVKVRAQGFGVSGELAVALPQAPGAELVVELVPEVLVSGSVLAPNGEPAAGATVRVDTGAAAWREQIDDATGFGAPSAKSDGSGRFELHGLTAGEHALFARSEDWARSDSVSVTLAHGEGVEGVTLVLREGGTLTGEIYLSDGSPAAGFFVQTTRMETFDQRMAFAAADGTFELHHLDEGSWQVVAMSMSGQTMSMPSGEDDTDAMADMMSQLKMTVADVVEGETTHVVLGAAPSDPVAVHGRVTHGGAPYAGGLVSFYAEGEQVMETMRNTTVAKDGSYSVELARPGQYVVQIQKIGNAGQQNAVEFARLIPAGEELELDFEIPSGRVSGLVEGPDGAPASGVRVSLHPEGALESGTLWGGQYVETTSDREGRYDIEGLRPGRYSLMAGGTTLGNMLASGESRHGRIVRGIVLGEGEWRRDEDFRLPEASKVKVKVIDASGKPVADAAVFARDASGRLLDRFSWVTTNASGSAEYAGLGKGRYSLAARKDGLASLESPPLAVGEGESADIELRLEPGTMLVITISGEGDELLNAQISVRDQHGNEVNGMLSLADLMESFGKGFSSKVREVGPLPPGKYLVEATGPNGEHVKKPVTLSGQEERKLTLRFD